MLISNIVDEILSAFRLPQTKQSIVLPQLLRKLKVLLEGHYQPTQGAKSARNVMGGPGGMRHGKTSLHHLQMLDEQTRLNEISLSPSLHAGSIKDQLESLITQIGFEAHKAEAVLFDNSELESKHIDEYYETVRQRLKKEKDQF